MNVQQLVSAIAALDAHDALQCRLTLEEWQKIAPYLSIRFLIPGEPLMREGDAERELYILAEGELQVTLQDTVIATQKPGAVVGEGTFFSGQPRSATVVPSQPGVAWALSWERFEALSHKQPRLALDLVRSVAAVLAVRMREALLVGQFT
ncbi:Crp/Fnr family transcriptional regulator [Variovorax terrae]|uniref:Cyclic nucleotide-binding domain-containing protein n=1 Tax=Variovorax terrae TaxID=2923278 RepID=A0A9X1W0Q4_9BURK|nr:cyclic nucleotide-binding domain-containing protein [Variovorax terrae]MCJ0765674.1 cyclic nucleotide-binding domain-containing protein [Variovorax terrae]